VSAEPLLSVRNLVTAFDTDGGIIRAVDDVSFDVPEGSTLGLVGESGCGKSVTSLSIMRLLPTPPGRVLGGQVIYRGKDLLTLPERQMRALRGDRISMIFQEPMTSLNPVYTVGSQIVEVLRIHRPISRRDARKRAIELLELVGIASPSTRVDSYPHELSGGMRQRVMIAMALACEPDLLIADEPTTALDVTIQAQILDLLRRLQEKLSMSVILITHDLGVVAEFAQKMVVMYAGRVVEEGSVADLFSRPMHPYTQGLLRSIPAAGRNGNLSEGGKPRRLTTIEGVLPSLSELPPGCRFQERCRYARERCENEEPELLAPAANRRARCFYTDEVAAS
jgi:peptide/nickel transport system ATP-binding protein